MKASCGIIDFSIGLALWCGGMLLLCYCPWLFAIAAVAFGVSAATSTRVLLRWLAVAMIAVSVAAAIEIAARKERVRSYAIELMRKSEGLQKSHEAQGAQTGQTP